MKLSELLRDVEVEHVEGALDVEIAEVSDDSRTVGPGDAFVALRGLTVDAHRFVGEVEGRGAAAVVAEEFDAAAGPRAGTTRVRVRSSTAALGRIAANRHGNPGAAMTMVGVTGTNGKTTTTFLVESILRAAGRRVGVIGTVNNRYHDGSGAPVVLPTQFTTPGPLELHRVLATMRAAGCTHVVMEVTSHAIVLGRLEGLAFRVAAFTNLTQDHLDLHRTMEEYYEAKAMLMRRSLHRRDGVGVVLIDGPYGERMANEVAGERILVSLLSPTADVHVLSARSSIEGTVAELASPLGLVRARSSLIGDYNLANIAVAAGVAVALGVDLPALERGISALAGVPGRIERVANGLGLPILVDYAHTPDALDNVITALRPLTIGRLLCVFGCGGDRDRSKRPTMGRVVAERADVAIVTSDNPRSEDPTAIVDEILAGVRDTGVPVVERSALAGIGRGVFVEVDRRTAIDAAVGAMQQDDVLLVAGKGHEDYQIIGRNRLPFDDRAVAREAIERRAGRGSSAKTP